MKKVRNLLIILVFIISLFLIHPQEAMAAGNELFVAPGAPASGPCTRAVPCDFRYAVEMVAQNGDTVYAHSGTYTALDPTAVHLLHVYKSVALYGSCSFDAETPVQCDTELMNSILDGEGDKRVITAYGLGTEQIHIEGFEIKNGNATALGSTYCEPKFSGFSGCGGGIHAQRLQSLTLKNTYIHRNVGGNPNGAGGGVYAQDINYVHIQNSSITNNDAAVSGLGFGGGIVLIDVGHQNPAIIKNSSFTGNETGPDSGAAGAGLLILDSNGVQIIGNRFQSNNAQHQKMDNGSAIYLNGSHNFWIEQNQFKYNYGNSVVNLRGAIGASDGFIGRNTWWENFSLYNLDIIGMIEVEVENNFLGFRAPSILSAPRGGASTDITIRGDCLMGAADVDLVFNTFAAADFGVMINECTYIDIYNNIFANLQIKGISVDLSDGSISRSISNNLFYDNVSDGDDIGTAAIFEDPKLANVSMGDFHLTHGSAAIDRAAAMNFDIDIDGDHRPVGTGATPFDLGADEYNPKLYMPLIMR